MNKNIKLIISEKKKNRESFRKFLAKKMERRKKHQKRIKHQKKTKRNLLKRRRKIQIL